MSRKKTKTANSETANSDPFAEREAQKYPNPIPSREFILQCLADAPGPLAFAAIASLLNVENEQKEALGRRLTAMERDGQLVRTRNQQYGPVNKMSMLRGRVNAHADGFGIVLPDEGGPEIFLPEKQMRTVMHGDRVVVKAVGQDRRNRREGVLVEILERAQKEIVGRFCQEHGIAYAEPNNKRIFQNILIHAGETRNAEHGQIVVVELLEFPRKHLPAIGRVLEVLGRERAPGMEVDIAIRDHNLPHQWTAEVEEEIKPLHRQKTIPKKMLEGREDLRQLPLVTIDGEDSRDFDDAVYCEPHGQGWRLLVAIADVSAYVKPGTALDAAARERGTSVYFPDRVIPMLPEVLSNGLCSLNPQVDRLCMVAELFIQKIGNVRRTRFFRGVMRSAARLTYTQVAAALATAPEQTETTPAVDAAILPHLRNLHALYRVLHDRRRKRGAIEFDSTETKIRFDENRKISAIVPVERNDAHRLIEEMMLAANVAAAEWLAQQKMPALYRVHEGPTAEKLTQVRAFLGELALSLAGKDDPQPKHYSQLLDKIKLRPDARLIQTVLLRSLKLAVYTPANNGHFGLAYDAYTHFTSPIRRYPDLLIHRAIGHLLDSKAVETFPYSGADMESLGEHCSATERRADEANRDALEWLKCEYLQDKVGETYDGLITGVTNFGIFVELDGLFVEGLVHVTSLKNDYYHFDASGHCLRGERTGLVYRLSDRLRVTVARVNLEERKIDFLLAGVPSNLKSR